MPGEETKALLKALLLGEGNARDRDLYDLWHMNETRIASLVTDEDASIMSLMALRGSLSREDVRTAFPSFRKRKEDNLTCRGLIEEDQGLFTPQMQGPVSLYPLLGEKNTGPAPKRPDDLVKGMIAMAAHQGIRERDWRLGKCFQTGEFLSAFPSLEDGALQKAAMLLADRLRRLGIVKDEGKMMVINSSNSLSFLSLSPEAAWSYLLWPDMDERDREKSFFWMSLLFRMGRVRKDSFPDMLTRLSVASGFTPGDPEDLFTLFLIEEKDGWIYPLEEERGTEGVVISSDWTINFSGSTPPLISLIAHLKTSDRMKIWLISKSSMKSAFALGYGTAEITRYLESLSDLPVSSMLTRRIESWEAEYRSLIFERALVLRTDATRDRIIGNIPQLAPYIIEHPKEGIFLMDYETEGEWRDLLYTFGFDMLAPTRGPEFRETVRSREFSDHDADLTIPEERPVPFDRALQKELISMIPDRGKTERKLKTLMIQKGILFSEEQIGRKLPFRNADCWNYMDKMKLLTVAEKDREWCILGEDWKGSSSIGTVEMVSGIDDGDQTVIGRTILSISRLYRVVLVPVCFV